MSQDTIDALAMAFAAGLNSLKRVELEGVGDNNGFWEFVPDADGAIRRPSDRDMRLSGASSEDLRQARQFLFGPDKP